MKATHIRTFGLLLATLLLVSGCFGQKTRSKRGMGEDGGGHNAAPSPIPGDGSALTFTPVHPASAALRVKQLVHGGPLTEPELAAILADPKNQLPEQLKTWLASPEFASKMTAFFTNIFQQRNLEAPHLDALTGGFLGDYTQQQFGFISMLQESFARTAWAIATSDQPFSAVTSTQTFMLTPALAMFLAYIDDVDATDDKRYSSYLVNNGAGLDVGWQLQGPTPRPLAEQIASRRFDITYDKSIVSCPDSSIISKESYAPGGPNDGPEKLRNLYYSFYGPIFGCADGQSGGTTPKLTAEDHTSWRPVKIRQPAPGEQPTAWYDLLTLRSSDTLVLRIPRVGFFTTPAFLGNWDTNASNVMRVTAQQTLIAALAMVFTEGDPTRPPNDDLIDTVHAKVNTPCYNCHKNLDPLARLFRRQLTLLYGAQNDTTLQNQGSGLYVAGVAKPLNNLYELGAALGAHPRFAIAMVQHLCHYANATACDEQDPEFIKLVQLNISNGLKFMPLAQAFFSSPLVTGLGHTLTFAENTPQGSLLRANHLCHSLGVRLGIPDPCHLHVKEPKSDPIGQIALAIPQDNYSRGSLAPAMPTAANLLTQASMESLCNSLSMQVIGAGDGPFPLNDPPTALAALVEKVVGIPPNHPAYATTLEGLTNHFAAAAQVAGISPDQAMRSAFVLACTAPLSSTLGL